MIRTALTWLAIIIATLWIIHNPAGAAMLAHHIARALTTLASQL